MGFTKIFSSWQKDEKEERDEEDHGRRVHQHIEDTGIGPSVVDDQDIDMGLEGGILKVDVQGEEDVPHVEDTNVYTSLSEHARTHCLHETS